MNMSFEAPKMSVPSIKSCRASLVRRDWKNIASVLLFYVVLYSFLAGFYALMLDGVIKTSPPRGQHTMLWMFFVMGVGFTVTVTAGVWLAQRVDGKKTLYDDEDAPQHRRNRSIDLRGVLKEDALQCV